MTARKDNRDPEPLEEPSPEESAADAAAAPEVPQERSDDLLSRLQRVTADYLNYQKRVQKDITEARTFANADLIKSLLPVLDDMERALSAARDNHGEDDPLYAGLQLVHDKAMDVFATFGVTRIDAVGQEFDPDCHAAIMRQPSDDVPPQTVVQELQTGYTLKGRTLRPASVIVSMAPEASDLLQDPDAQE